MKNIISLKLPNHTSNAIIDSNATLADPTAVANASKNNFSITALDIQSSIRHLFFFKKKFFEFLPSINIDSSFISPTDTTEVSNITSSLDVHKAVGLNSIVPTNVLKVSNKHLSNQLPSFFNLSLSSGIF